jgi:hypothetical protein
MSMNIGLIALYWLAAAAIGILFVYFYRFGFHKGGTKTLEAVTDGYLSELASRNGRSDEFVQSETELTALQSKQDRLSLTKKLKPKNFEIARNIGRLMVFQAEVSGASAQERAATVSPTKTMEKCPISLDRDQLVFIAYLAKTGLDAISDGGIYDGTSAGLNDSDSRAAAAILRVFEQDVGARK